jgi:serine/threonine protein kinase
MIKKYSIDDFNLLTVLGKGLYGKVFLVRELETQRVFALKVMKKSLVERKHKEQVVFA